MKKQFLSFVLMLVVSILWSQNQFVVSAFNYLRQGKLDKALQNIEPATTHPQTMNQAKTWLYRGNIYLAIHLTKEEKYKNLAVSPLDSAFVSYDKAIQLDPEFYMPTVDPASPKIGLKYVAEEYYNLGVDKYQNKDFQSAIKYFELAKKAETKRGAAQDSTSTYNASCYNIALAALTLNDTSTTIKNLNEVIKNKFKNLNAYILLSNLYLSKNDTSNAKKIINRGRTIFPDSVPMLIIEINYYLKSNNVKKAQEILQKAIQKDPSNPTLYYAIGANYDKLISTITNPEEKERMIQEAIHAYQKAIELKPNYFDAIYNLGALYFNLGVEVYQYASSLPYDAQDEYEKAKAKYLDYWQKALPYFEKALELNPKETSLIDVLYKLYNYLQMPEKAKKMKELKESLKQ